MTVGPVLPDGAFFYMIIAERDSCSNLDITNVIAFDTEISHLVILMGLTYLAGVVGGLRKYR